MVSAETGTPKILEDYINADEKYLPAPLPVHLKPVVVSERIVRGLNPPPARLRKLRRFVKLAAFYQATETADTFKPLWQAIDGGESALERSALALEAIGWVGDSDDRQEAVNVIDRLLAFNRPDKFTREALLAVFNAWGPSLELSKMVNWLKNEHQKLKAQLADLQQRGATDEAELVEDELDDIVFFSSSRVRAVQQENKTRTGLVALAPDERVNSLAFYYLEDSPGSSSALSIWAGLELVRLVRAQPELAVSAAAVFVELAEKYRKPTTENVVDEESAEPSAIEEVPDSPPELELDSEDIDADDDLEVPVDDTASDIDGDPQLEADLIRATCLRAAVYFNAELTESDSEWLSEQKDHGVDLLYPRPEWSYH